MSLSLLIATIVFLYILDVFLIIWSSGKFAGIKPFPLKAMASIGIAIILFSWLALSAFIYVPLIIKPLIIIISWIITIYIFISLINTHVLRAIASGTFFVICQLVLFVFLLQQLWDKDFFQIVKIILFQ